MARGDWTTFEEAALDILKGVFGDLSSETIKLALIDNTVTPAPTDATPRWADYSANEVSGTGYTAGGATLSGVTVTEAAGVGTLDDTANVTWAQNGAGPTDIYWGVLVVTSMAGAPCLGFVDMGGPASMVDGSVTVTWNDSGILTATVFVTA